MFMLQLPGDECMASPTETSENSLGAQIQGYSGPNLPQEIWNRILSLLPLRDAAQVACVSHDFVRSWRSRPHLIFTNRTLGLLDQRSCPKDDFMRNFVDRVDNILKTHSGIGLKTLNVSWVIPYTDDDHCYIDHLDNWLKIAVKPELEELVLQLAACYPQYNFSCSLLSGGNATSLRLLKLCACGFHPTVAIGCLRSLTKLELCGVCIEEDELRCLLSNTPALEWLEVRYCYPITNLRIPCLQHLSHLGISCEEKYMVQSIQSKAPNLSSFYFQDEIRFLLLLGEMTLLQIKKLYMVCKSAVFYALTELPSSMPSLETLTISSHGEDDIPPMVSSKFLHLRSLSISYGSSPGELSALANFLYTAPNLETLVLTVRGMECSWDFADPSYQRIMLEHHRHEKLKRVKILGFTSAKYLVEFTCRILESAVSLKRLTLDTMLSGLRCSVSKSGKCWFMSTEAVVEAREAVLAVERYIKPKVPSTVELNVLEPCSRCHAAQILDAGYHDDSTQCSGS